MTVYATVWDPSWATVLLVDDGFLYDNRTSLQIVQNLDYLPFGELNSSDSGITSHKFTGDERDSETNLDHTWFRKYSSTLGRWMTPDPASLAAVDPTSPQSWNRYAYVLNAPLELTDSFGLCGGGPGSVTVSIGGTQPPGTGTVSTSDPCPGGVGGGGGGGFTWPCIGFVSTGPNGPGCPQAPKPPSPLSGAINSILNALRKSKVVNYICNNAADTATVGVGVDVGLGITGSGQLNVTGNGVNGDLTLSMAGGFSYGLIGPDAYVSVTATPTAPDNSFLDTQGQTSTTYTGGISRFAYSTDFNGTQTGTVGPSLLPVTVAATQMMSKPLVTVPYVGYLVNNVRAACKVVKGR
ncbi:MAG TPA: RHS repeat-associated core domain-containing protein [Candidatus Acidoferrum sp.]|nr:RHS repeat-associated core domain-containing protein [Candidatus Acidoferrum sp.]